MKDNCIFCKIIKGEIPAKIVYEDDKVLIFNDIEPKCKNHYLCVPKIHFATLEEMDENASEYLKYCFEIIARLKDKLFLQNGYRLIINQGQDAGQSVAHLHIHILSGRKMDWNPA